MLNLNHLIMRFRYLLLFLPFFLFSSFASSLTPLQGFLIDCGAPSSSNIAGLVWLPDGGFISTGTPKNVTTSLPYPALSSVRSFPLRVKKHCYNFLVFPGKRYMVRTTYFYGGVNGHKHPSPPAFDQIVDGTFWSVVNTTEDYANGNFTFYEGVFSAQGKTMSVCIGSNTYTDSDPFISALELVTLSDSLYNATDFNNFRLNLVARHSFGYSGPTIRYPDDSFDRFWEPFGESNFAQAGSSNISVSGFWNLPPLKIFETQLGSDQLESLELKWPPESLQSSKFYISLYFANNEESSLGGSRIFNISVNGIGYYHDLNVTSDGVVVFARQWPLSGPTTITLTRTASSSLGPVINAGEIFDVVPLGGRTLTRDVIALKRVKDSFQNPPLDWVGDPCMPRQYSWTGITCSEGRRIRVVTLNMTGLGLSGSLSPDIVNMTALTNIWLGNNNLSGHIPDLSSLNFLETLHLEDNQFSGEIPLSLGNISSLHEMQDCKIATQCSRDHRR
ncbi:putative leucine-rich repeat receptor-like serine/threonine-protein kinase At2g14440 isoform X2 [Prosopis cineraria]|uniref:putative leucine-rich repeat receptor-like serine/threonine-protein kinase At2g14440 isoform X2 n=1 Tax=Prosopis cineraria TaxID=364024 RepID=UPI00241050A5|nr:putative leucine-rich repeat receptor-like serine/threonine-protein kinase At2g14440 isoform X2 [Prosopis cineraria]